MLEIFSFVFCISKINPIALGNYCTWELYENYGYWCRMDMVMEEITELELNIDELVDVALRTNYAQDLDLNVDIDSVDVNDVAPLIVKLSDAKRRALWLSSFLLENSLYYGVNKIIGFEKLVGNLDEMIVASLGRQHQRSLDS